MLLHIYVLNIPPLIPFSTVISISISVNNSNFTLVLFKQACHANPGADKNEECKVHIFRYTCF